jgi:hypothetical protein
MSSTSPSTSDGPCTYTRACLQALHQKPMSAAWSRHVTGAVEFIKARVLKEALAGFTEYDFSAIADVAPAADEVLEAIGSRTTKAAPAALTALHTGLTMAAPPHFGFGSTVPETWKASGQLDPQTGLLLAASSSGRSELQLSGQCMPDIVSALKLVFTDADIAFVRAAPSSGGKHILSIKWS